MLIGIREDDTQEDSEYLVKKILGLRLFDGNGKPWSQSVKDIDGDVLCVSQFTLQAKTSKGLKPDFHLAMKSSLSSVMYDEFLAKMRSQHPKIHDGQFGAMMAVSIVNDGPVTILIDSKDK